MNPKEAYRTEFKNDLGMDWLLVRLGDKGVKAHLLNDKENHVLSVYQICQRYVKTGKIDNTGYEE